ncbi:MAG: hypothetical protein DSZ03_06940 [Sulfurimonas sp.]|nr:MAG: hypothetical protein DSZ03_06940 [Sulfurimonas sp.]
MKKDSEKFKMHNEKKKSEDPFKDYQPEVIEYDPAVDGDEEHNIRDEHLSEKEKLLEQFKHQKPDAKAKKFQHKRKV